MTILTLIFVHVMDGPNVSSSLRHAPGSVPLEWNLCFCYYVCTRSRGKKTSCAIVISESFILLSGCRELVLACGTVGCMTIEGHSVVSDVEGLSSLAQS